MTPHKNKIPLLAAAVLAFSVAPGWADQPGYNRQQDYRDMTPADITAAKKEARARKIDVLRVCADPGNLPLSDIKQQGFQNKIVDAVAKKMGAAVNYFWRPYLERGLTRSTFENKECDILLEIPSDYEHVLTTTPLYRSTYVFATRADKTLTFDGLDDPRLKTLRLGVFQQSGMREALARHGIKNNLDIHAISQQADLRPEEQPWTQVQKVIDGDLDVAAVWGPFAGFLKTKKNEPIALQPTNVMEKTVQLEFDLSWGVRTNDVVLKFALDNAMEGARDEIAAILNDYGVPLVECSKCVVQGTLPSAGALPERYLADPRKRFVEAPDELRLKIDPAKASADQIVDRQRLEDWLKSGVDIHEEFANAALASDRDRLAFLLEKGARIDELSIAGISALHVACDNRDSALVAWLLDHGASADLPDARGWTPLMHAVYRNHVPSIEALVKHGAKIDGVGQEVMSPLGLAIGEGKFFAAKALLDSGASVEAKAAPQGVTPLMLVATRTDAESRDASVAQGPPAMEIARAILSKGAKVDAVSDHGVTALMVAAGSDNAPMIGLLIQSGAANDAKTDQGRTALDIAQAAGNDAAVKALKVFAATKRG